jgi:hypothetical protein
MVTQSYWTNNMIRIILFFFLLHLVTDKAQCQTDADTTYSVFNFERSISGADTIYYFVTTATREYSSGARQIKVEKLPNLGLNAARRTITAKVADAALVRDRASATATQASNLVTRFSGLATDLESVATGSTPAPRLVAPPPPPQKPVEPVQISPPTFNLNGTVTYDGATWRYNSKSKKWRRL